MKSVRIRSYSGSYFAAYGILWSISLYSVRMQKNAEQNNSENGHSLRSVHHPKINILMSDPLFSPSRVERDRSLS